MKKKILLVNIGEPLPTNGNKPHRMFKLLNYLNEDQSLEVNLLTTDFEHQSKTSVECADSKVIQLKSLIKYKSNIGIPRLLNHTVIALNFIRFLYKSKTKYSCILCSYPTILLSLITVLYGKINNIKTVIDVRDKWPDIFIKYWVFKPVIFPLFIFKLIIFTLADKIIAVSPDYLSWSKAKNGVVIPLSKPERVAQSRILQKNKINLIFVGSLGSTYDLELIVELTKILSNSNLKFETIICGTGPQQKIIEDASQYLSQLKFKGWLKETQLSNELNEASFGLMFYKPGAPQGWPNKLAEYLSFGIPILNSLDGESFEYIKNKNVGINFKHSEIQSLAERIINMSETEYNNLSSNCLKAFKEDFEDNKCQKKLKKEIL